MISRQYCHLMYSYHKILSLTLEAAEDYSKLISRDNTSGLSFSRHTLIYFLGPAANFSPWPKLESSFLHHGLEARPRRPGPAADLGSLGILMMMTTIHGYTSSSSVCVLFLRFILNDKFHFFDSRCTIFVLSKKGTLANSRIYRAIKEKWTSYILNYEKKREVG